VWVLALCALCVWPLGARADLAGEMDNMFNSMASVTPPGAYKTALRGVLSGGNVAVNNRIFNADIVNFTPPGFKAGCGGIDVFAGSFSFINAAQFEQLLKSIASNATGYAFQLAMNAMCSSCMAQIETLARKLQQATSELSNSCQLAQGLVNDVSSGFNQQDSTKASLINMATGAEQDAFAAFKSLSSPSPVVNAVNASPATAAQTIQGNVTWRALVQQNSTSWFQAADDLLREELMTLGGTYIVGHVANDSVTGATQDLNQQAVAGRPDLLDTMIAGGTANILVCDDTDMDGCLAPKQQSINLTGFSDMILTAFEGTLQSNGTRAGGGIIDAVVNNVALTPTQQLVQGLLPSSYSGLVVRLATRNYSAAQKLAEIGAPLVGLMMAEAMATDMMRATEASVMLSQDTHAKDAQKLIESSWTALRQREAVLQTRYGSLMQLAQAYQSMMLVTSPLPRSLVNSGHGFSP
jgi:conjugative transfer pilus assembly protein TraH